jgi:hypothetical protein
LRSNKRTCAQRTHVKTLYCATTWLISPKPTQHHKHDFQRNHMAARYRRDHPLGSGRPRLWSPRAACSWTLFCGRTSAPAPKTSETYFPERTRGHSTTLAMSHLACNVSTNTYDCMNHLTRTFVQPTQWPATCDTHRFQSYMLKSLGNHLFFIQSTPTLSPPPTHTPSKGD